jgi:mono/diheme cytochrome c family protein
MSRLIVLAAAMSLGLTAQADPFAGADPARGKTLADKSCVTCHSSNFGGDATRIYTRADHKVKSPAQLLKQVGVCSQAAKTDWSKQDIADVAAYLNQTFYRFQ